MSNALTRGAPDRLYKRGRWSHLEREELAPCGSPGLTIISTFASDQVDLIDCLVVRPRPFRLIIWEPLKTKAPSPPKAAAHCCYIQTVIFYVCPYTVRPYKQYWRDRDGKLRAGSGGFEIWDQVESRLRSDDVVSFENECFVVSGGRVVWAKRRWWMCHGARRAETRRAA